MTERDKASAELTGVGIAILLRDFFFAENSGSLREVWSGIPDAPYLDEHGMLALEYEFNRLFIGPDAPVAPPCASVYLEKEPRLMGASTLAVRRLYDALGVSAGGIPDDFIGCELEAWLLLTDLGADGDQDAFAALKWLTSHMLEWIPLFLGRLAEAGLSPAMERVVQLVEIWEKKARL